MNRPTAMTMMLLVFSCCADAVDPPAANNLPAGYRLDAHMRDTGYVLGDLMKQRVDVTTPTGARLASDSVPRLGRVNNWMELQTAEVERHGSKTTLLFTYQVFGAVEGAMQLAVPGFKLRFSDGPRTVSLPVSPQIFTLSPVLPATMTDEDRKPRPSPAPDLMPENPSLIGALLSLLSAALMAFYLLWTHDRMPFFQRNPGPLAALFRRLRRRGSKLLEVDAYQDLLRQVHDALNRSASETLYVDNLPLLFVRAPYLQPLQDDIHSLFLHSRQVFYGAAWQVDSWQTSQIVALCRSARDCERGVR